MSCGKPPPPTLDRTEGGPGLRAALRVPRGVEEAVMLEVTGVSEEERAVDIRKGGGDSDC